MVKDLQLRVADKDKLWLKWSKVEHLGNGIIKLISPKFEGPVLSDCLPIEEKGQLPLDLTEHFIILTPTPYQIILKWDKKIEQTTSYTTFEEMYIDDRSLGLLKILKDNDSILLDCSKHTLERMKNKKYKISFTAMVYKEDKIPYELT